MNTTTPVTQSQPTEGQVRLVDVEITSDNAALNVMAGFLNLAQRRGAFSIDESSKIYECIKFFTQKTTNTEQSQTTQQQVPTS